MMKEAQNYITIEVKVKRLRRFWISFRVAVFLIKLAGFFSPIKVIVEVEDGRIIT